MSKIKYLYIAFVVLLALLASIFTYMSTQGTTEAQISKLSKTSLRYVKSINACKNARLEIDNNVFELKNEIAEVLDVNAYDGMYVLRYGHHAVRGYMDSGSVNDMVCTYDLNDGSGIVKTYVAVLTGLTEESFATFDNISIGQNITVTDMQIIGAGKVKIIFKGNKTGISTEKTVYLDGDTLGVN